MKEVLLTDAPYCRDVRAQRTLSALFDLNVSLTVFDQGFDIETSQGMLPEGVKHFSSPIPSNKIGRFVWHMKNNLLPHMSLRTTNQIAYDVLCKSTPDAIHLVNPFLGDAVMRYLGEHIECKLVYEAYEYWPEYLYDEEFGVRKAIRNHLATTEKSLLEKSSVFITVSEPIVEYYKRIAPLAKSAVIYNANVKESKSMSNSVAEVNNPPKVVFSGQFAADRNVDMLLEAITHMRQQVDVTLLGRGPQKENYERLIMQRKLTEKVLIKNPVPADELISELEQYDIGVHLVSPQTLQQNGAVPNKIFDYLRANLALVSVETDGVKSLDLDDCIAYVTPLSVETLAEVLDELVVDNQRLSAMKRASAHLKSRFTSHNESQKIQAIYQDLMSDE